MLFSRPRGGVQWPHDMMLRIDTPGALTDLLWIREAWGLNPIGENVPPPLAVTPEPVDPGRRAAAPLEEWTAAWPELWSACARHAGTPCDENVVRRTFEPDLDPDERRRLHLLVRGPTWRDRFGKEAYAEGHREWANADVEQRRDRLRGRADPERSDLAAVIPAWEAGLTEIVEVPCRGTFTRVLGPHGLLVTAGTRADPARYRAALATFAG